jgi:hypothetical protein
MTDRRETALEQRLRDAYRAADLPDAPDRLWAAAEQPPADAIARRPGRFAAGPVWRLAAILVLATLAGSLVLVVGSGRKPPAPIMTAPTGSPLATPVPSAGDAASPSVAGIVPWSAETPPPPAATPTPTASAPEARECTAGELAVGRAGFGGATGSMAGVFSVWTTGPQPCRVEGSPGVEMLDGDGRRLVARGPGDGNGGPGPVTLLPGRTIPVLGEDPALGTATVGVQWGSWCKAAPKEPLSLRVTFLGGAVIGSTPVETHGMTPRCDVPRKLSGLSVGPFEAAAGPSPTEPPSTPASTLTGHLELPDHAFIGQPLRYVMVITNPTSVEVTLQPCPAYRERLSVAGKDTIEEHTLNCDGLPPLAPGATLRFEMVLQVPDDLTPTNQAGIIWELDPYYGSGRPGTAPNDKAVLTIAKP